MFPWKVRSQRKFVLGLLWHPKTIATATSFVNKTEIQFLKKGYIEGEIINEVIKII